MNCQPLHCWSAVFQSPRLHQAMGIFIDSNLVIRTYIQRTVSGCCAPTTKSDPQLDSDGQHVPVIGGRSDDMQTRLRKQRADRRPIFGAERSCTVDLQTWRSLCDYDRCTGQLALAARSGARHLYTPKSIETRLLIGPRLLNLDSIDWVDFMYFVLALFLQRNSLVVLVWKLK